MSGAASAVFCCGFFLSLLCVLAVAARIVFTRKAKIIGLADYLMTLGTVSSLSSFILIILIARKGCFIVSNIIICPVLFSGFGRQDWVLDLAEPPKGAKWIVFWGLFFTISTVPIKASVCLSLLRYAQYRVYRTVVYGLIGLVIFAAVTLFVTILRACQPVSYLWNPGNQTGACDHIGLTIASIYIFAAISIFIDLCITMLPPLLFWNVRKWELLQDNITCI